MALDPQVAAMEIPEQWKTEMARWSIAFQRAWLDAVGSGDNARAQAIVAEARASPWQYNSAGQIYPNNPWFASLSPADQSEHVARLNDPGRIPRQIQELGAALAGASGAEAERIRAEIASLQQMQAGIDADRTNATSYLQSSVYPPQSSAGGGGGGGGGTTDPTAPPPTDPTAPPAGGSGDQGKYAQDVDEAARADPQSFVRYILGQMGADSTGTNPLTASAIRKASLTPYMRELMAGGYQNAPLYTFGDWVEAWTRNNSQPGRAGGGTGTAFTMGQGNTAIRGLLGRATNKDNLEYDALGGESSQDALANIKTYLAAGYADSMDPTYQRALQANADRQHQSYMDSVYGGNAKDSFVDWYAREGTKWMR